MRAVFFTLLLIFSSGASFADEEISPKEGWEDFETVEKDVSLPFWKQALLWPVNRVADLIDVFRFDVGVGPAAGAVVRVTRAGQIGFRDQMPFSLRVGNFGRSIPIVIERESELGAGPTFLGSDAREICAAELGGGLDLFLVGAHVGFCGEEFIDFIAGIFFLDISDDDIR